MDRGQTGFLTALHESESGDTQALVVMVIAPEAAALAMVREAIDNGLYDNFVFGDAAKRLSLVRSLGGARLGNMYGIGPASAPKSAASAAWEAAYVAEYGALPVLVKETMPGRRGSVTTPPARPSGFPRPTVRRFHGLTERYRRGCGDLRCCCTQTASDPLTVTEVTEGNPWKIWLIQWVTGSGKNRPSFLSIAAPHRTQ